MRESAPSFISLPTTTRKLVFAQDLNAAMGAVVGAVSGIIPDESMPEGSVIGLRWHLLKITGDESGGGTYKADYYLAVKHDGLDPSKGVSEDNLFDTSERLGNDAVFKNLFEAEKSTHELTDSRNTDMKLCLGLLVGHWDDDRPVFYGFSFMALPCESQSPSPGSATLDPPPDYGFGAP